MNHRGVMQTTFALAFSGLLGCDSTVAPEPATRPEPAANPETAAKPEPAAEPVPAAEPYRPAMRTPRPQLQGVQSFFFFVT